MSSQRLGRHQRRASQSVFALPENFAALDDVPPSDDHRKASAADGGAAGERQDGARPAAGRHRRAMSMAVSSSRDLEMIKEDIGGYNNYKIGA